MQGFTTSRETEGAWETEETAQPWWDQQIWGGLQEEGAHCGYALMCGYGEDPLLFSLLLCTLEHSGFRTSLSHPQNLARTICHAAPWGWEVRAESYGGNQHIGQFWERRNLNMWLQGWSSVHDTHFEHFEEEKFVISRPGMAPLS